MERDTQPNESEEKAYEQDSFTVTAPSISLPKGGGAIRGIGEKFAANPVTDTGSMTIPNFTNTGSNSFRSSLVFIL